MRVVLATKALAVHSLERMMEGGCGTPGCSCRSDTLSLTQVCHPNAGLRASYTRGTGVLTLTCAKCHTLLADVAVALVSS
jgi:hypothetical protein